MGINQLNRRQWALFSAAAVTTAAHGQDDEAPTLGLGFSLYGMRKLPIDEALQLVWRIGYDCVELPVMADWPGDSAKLGEQARAGIARQLDDTGLRLSAVMENLPLLVDDSQHAENLRRIGQAAELAHGLTDREPPPVMETILGGRPAQWDMVRDAMARRLEDWAAAAEQARMVVAIKAHVGGAMHRPEHPAWLAQKVGSPWIRCAYDYSHFRLREIDMAESVRALASRSVFVHVKDAAGDASRVQFLLPGKGDIDYPQLLKLLIAAGYDRDIVVEVSGQLHGKPDYDPAGAARFSFDSLQRAFQAAKIQQRR